MNRVVSSAGVLLAKRKWFGGRNVLSVVTLSLGLLLLGACSQTSMPEANRPTRPDIATWDWATIGYTDSSSDTNVEIIDSGTGQSVIMSGTGNDIFGTSDAFVFTYTELGANGYLQARLEDFIAPTEWSKAGIMIRESLDSSARNAVVLVSGQMGAVFQARDSYGATTQVKGYDPSRGSGGTWLRLTRSGNNVLAELSGDGHQWTEFARYTFASSTPLLIGFAVAANASLAPSVAVATFSNVELAEAATGTPTRPTPPVDNGPQDPSDPHPNPNPPDSARGFSLPAATLYASPTGSASNSGRDASQPTSLRRAIEVAGPGDVVYLRGGTYPINAIFNKSGTSANPIIWASAPGEWAVFDGAGLAKGVALDHVWVTGDWNIIANIEVRNSPQQGILVSGANNNTLFGIISHSNHGTGIQLMNSNRNRLENVITYNNFDSNNTRGQPGQDADGIGLSSGDGNLIYNCVSYFNSDDGVDLWKSTNSVIDGCISFSNGRGASGNGNGFKLGGPVTNNSIVRRSIAFNNLAAGFTSNGGQQVTMINNTAYGNAGSNFQGSGTTTMRNNISESGRVNQNGASGQNNSWDLGLQSSRLASTDPQNALFLSLDASSPARGAGNTNVPFSYEGTAPDLGALQYPLTWASLLNNGLFNMGEALARVP